MVEAGLARPGERLVDAGGAIARVVRADGALAVGPAVGSIHKIGALAQGLPACNGWTFWHIERAGAAHSDRRPARQHARGDARGGRVGRNIAERRQK